MEKVPLKQRLRRIAAYGAFFAFCFVVSMYFTFPWGALRGRVVSELEKAAPGYRFRIADISPTFTGGIRAEGVEVRKVSPRADAPPDLSLDALTLHAWPWVALKAAITKRASLSFSAEAEDGTLEGAFDQAADATDIDLTFDAMPLGRVAPLRAYVGLPAGGALSGDVALHVAEKPEATSGSIDLQVSGLTVGDGTAKLKVGMLSDGITVETIRVGKLDIEIGVEKGAIEVTKFGAAGPDLELKITGDGKLQMPLKKSKVDLVASIRFTDAYKKKSDRTRGMFALLENLPQLAPARTADGALQYRLAGSLGGQLIPRPAGKERPARRGGRSAK